MALAEKMKAFFAFLNSTNSFSSFSKFHTDRFFQTSWETFHNSSVALGCLNYL